MKKEGLAIWGCMNTHAHHTHMERGPALYPTSASWVFEVY